MNIYKTHCRSHIGLNYKSPDERDGVSNHQPPDCLLNCLFSCRSKKTSKLRVSGLCAGNSPVNGEFPTQRARDAESVSISWRHYEKKNRSKYNRRSSRTIYIHMSKNTRPRITRELLRHRVDNHGELELSISHLSVSFVESVVLMCVYILQGWYFLNKTYQTCKGICNARYVRFFIMQYLGSSWVWFVHAKNISVSSQNQWTDCGRWRASLKPIWTVWAEAVGEANVCV